MLGRLRKRIGRRGLGIGVTLIVVALIGGLIYSSMGGPANAASTLQTVAVTRGTIVATIVGSGTVNAANTLDQSFGTTGTVTEVFVEEGQSVEKGDVLARLDTRDLELAVGEAKASLSTANAQFEQASEGNATPEEQAAAQAQVDNARAQLEQTRTGNITTADIADAEASIRSSEASLLKARTGNYTAADVADAQASLRSAEAELAQTRKGTTTASDVASAEATVRNAQAQLDKAISNNVTAEDIANAEAKVRTAEAQYQQASAGPKADVVSSAQAAVEQAQQNYDTTTTTAAATKAKAEQDLAQAADTVRLAQEDYSTAYWNDEQAKNGQDPSTGKSINDAAVAEATVQRQYEAAFRQAEINLEQAESQLEQANISLEQAKQQEVTDVQSAQTQLDDARVQLAEIMKGPEAEDVAIAQSSLDQARNDLQKLKNGGTSADIAAAQANLDQANASLAALYEGPSAEELTIAQAKVDQARANLQKVQQGGTQADIATAQASVDQAKANLQKTEQGGTEAEIAAAQASLEQQEATLAQLTAPATTTDLNIQQANVESATQAVKRAELNLEAATLTAPFDGIVTTVNIVPGSVAASGTAALTLIDRSTLHVDLKLSENDVVNTVVGQQVRLTIDSLSDWSVVGEVSYIASAAETTNDVVTYSVRVRFPDDDARVKVGMTANLDITTARKENVLLVPNSALLPKGSGRAVQVPNLVGTDVTEIEVETGLTDGTYTEILSGLEAGDQVVETPNTSTQPGGGGPFGG